PLRGARAPERVRLRGRRRATRVRGPPRGAREPPRPGGLPASLRRPVPGPAVALLRRGRRAHARDGAVEAARGGAPLRQPRIGRPGEPPRAARSRGRAELPAPEGGHAAPRERGLPDPTRGPGASLAEGCPEDRPARAPRHLPGAAARPTRRPPDRPPRLDRAPPRGHEALPARRSPRPGPRADAQEGARSPARDAARGPSRRLRGPQRDAHHDDVDGAPPRYELVHVLGGTLRGSEEGRDGDGEPDPRPLPAGLLRDRRL